MPAHIQPPGGSAGMCRYGMATSCFATRLWSGIGTCQELRCRVLTERDPARLAVALVITKTMRSSIPHTVGCGHEFVLFTRYAFFWKCLCC